MVIAIFLPSLINLIAELVLCQIGWHTGDHDSCPFVELLCKNILETNWVLAWLNSLPFRGGLIRQLSVLWPFLRLLLCQMAKASLQIRLLGKFPSVTDDNWRAFFRTLGALLCPDYFAQFAPELLEVSERLFLHFGYRILKTSHILAIFLSYTYAFFE